MGCGGYLLLAQDEDSLRRPRQTVDVVEALEVLEVGFVPLVVPSLLARTLSTI